MNSELSVSAAMLPDVIWQYTLADLMPEQDPEEWASKLAAQGWHLPPWRSGAETTVNGRTFTRYMLRRAVDDDPSPGEV